MNRRRTIWGSAMGQTVGRSYAKAAWLQLRGIPAAIQGGLVSINVPGGFARAWGEGAGGSVCAGLGVDHVGLRRFVAVQGDARRFAPVYAGSGKCDFWLKNANPPVYTGLRRFTEKGRVPQWLIRFTEVFWEG